MSEPAPSPRRVGGPRTGLAFAIGAYGLWGVLPGYFLALDPASPWEIVALRVLATLGFCALLLTVLRGWRGFAGLARQPRVLAAMGVAAALIYLNWQVFVLAALSGNVLESALGYFINPILTVALGVVLLRERLRPLQWAAVGVSLLAVVVIVVGYGVFPVIALVLALTFALYAYIKKRVGAQVDAIGGLTLETAWLVPVAIVQLIVTGSAIGLSIGSVSVVHTLLLLASGVVTAVPLLMFAAAARRLPLVMLGFTQYLAPVMQFLTGAFLLHEPMPPGRWAGFGLVWVAIALLTVDALRSARLGRRASPASA